MKAGGTGRGGVLVLEMSNPNVLKYLKSFLDYTFIPFIFFCCWKFMFPFFNPIDKGMGLNRLIYFKGKNYTTFMFWKMIFTTS